MIDYAQIVHCPIHGAPLEKKDNGYSHKGCHTVFQEKNGILNLLPPDHNLFRTTEERFWDLTYEQEGKRKLDNRSAPFHEHFRKPLVDLPRNSLILELGCGNRADGFEIAQAGQNVIETDVSLKALELARQLANDIGVQDRVAFILADAEHIPFADNSFDGVLMAAAFHHLENPGKGLLEIKRVTKNGGVVVFGVEPNRWPYKLIYPLLAPVKRLIRKRRDRSVDSVADDSSEGFSKQQIERLFADTGIELNEMRPVKYTLELYDSYVRLKERMSKGNAHPSKQMQRLYQNMDSLIERIPFVNQLAWHWNIIGTVHK